MSNACEEVESCRLKGCAAKLKFAECGAIVDSTPDYTAFAEMLEATDWNLSTSVETESIDTIGDCTTRKTANNASYTGSLSYIWCYQNPVHCMFIEGCYLQFCAVPTGDDPTVIATPALLGTILITGVDMPISATSNQQHSISFEGDGALLRDNWCTNVIPFAQRFKVGSTAGGMRGRNARQLYKDQIAMPGWKQTAKAA